MAPNWGFDCAIDGFTERYIMWKEHDKLNKNLEPAHIALNPRHKFSRAIIERTPHDNKKKALSNYDGT